MNTLDCIFSVDEAVISCYVAPKLKAQNVNKTETKTQLIDKIIRILGIQNETILKEDTNLTLKQIGIDSLMLVEVKQILEREYNENYSSNEIGRLTIDYILKLDSTNK